MIFFRTARWAKNKGRCPLCVTVNSNVAGPTEEKLLETMCRKESVEEKLRAYWGGKTQKEEGWVKCKINNEKIITHLPMFYLVVGFSLSL